jgi:hypothetical protein
MPYEDLRVLSDMSYLTLDYKLTNEDSIANVQKWKRVKSTTVVSFQEAFTTKAFEDDCMFSWNSI